MKYVSLNKRQDFSRTYKKGKSIVHPQVVVYIRRNPVGYTRIGITTSKKIGTAVERNRARRVIRHALYNVLPQNVGNYDIVLVARGYTKKLKSTQLQTTLQSIFKKENLI